MCGFLWFLWHGLRHTKRVAQERDDDIGVAALAARAALWCLLILSLTDPHLTFRGGSDLFFCLLGLERQPQRAQTGSRAGTGGRAATGHSRNRGFGK